MDYAGKASERHGHTTGSHRQEPPSKGDVFVQREQRTSDGAARAEAKPTTNREQCQACFNIAEVRTDGAARAEPSLLELCRVVTEEEEVKEKGEANLFGLCRVVTEQGVAKFV